MKAFIVGLVVAVIASGSAAAATPARDLSVRARLAPIAGTKATGKFSGLLVKRRVRHITPGGTLAAPSTGQWELTWNLTVPNLDGLVTASLRFGSGGSSAHATRTLCPGCSTGTRGTMALTARQVARIRGGDAVVVVRTGSAQLRGRVKASPS